MPPPTKLYKVAVGFSLYVLARDEADAQGVAIRNAATELGRLQLHECLADVAEVDHPRDIAVEWRHSRPYSTPGATHERLTCVEALAAIQAAARKADLPGQGKLFGGTP